VPVLTAASEACELIARGERFDVIVCDLMMPKMTGMDLHAELTALASDQAERMVLLTGGAFTEKAREFLESVPNIRVEKPLDSANLRAMVRGLVR
jgi:CheY-like chemotaxis protein